MIVFNPNTLLAKLYAIGGSKLLWSLVMQEAVDAGMMKITDRKIEHSRRLGVWYRVWSADAESLDELAEAVVAFGLANRVALL